MTKTKMICLDMDDTLNLFYNYPDWLYLLRAEDPTPYAEAEAKWDMKRLTAVLRMLQGAGWEITIITWLSKGSSEAYKDATRQAKRDWLARYGIPYDHFHGVQYGTTKADTVRRSAYYAVLVDDNKAIRDGWTLGATIDPNAVDIVKELKKLAKWAV